MDKSVKNLKPDSDFVLTSLSKPNIVRLPAQKSKSFIKIPPKVSLLPDKKLVRTTSQDTENSGSTTSNSNADVLKLPPILLPIISKLEKRSGSLSSSVGPNIDSSSSMASGSDAAQSSSSSSSSESSESETEDNVLPNQSDQRTLPELEKHNSSITDDTLSNLSSNASILSTSESEKCSLKSRSVKSAASGRAPPVRTNSRAATAKPKKSTVQSSPTDR